MVSLPARLLPIAFLLIAWTSTFEASRTRSLSKDSEEAASDDGKLKCCCKEAPRVTAKECFDKGYKWTEGSPSKCCAKKKKRCPPLSHYARAKNEMCTEVSNDEDEAGDEDQDEDDAEEELTPEQEERRRAETDPQGAYLTYRPIQHGTLTMRWSKTKVDDALGFISPGKAVPPFKFAPGNKRETRSTGDYTKLTYRNTWAAFAKLGKQYDGHLVLFMDAPVHVVLLSQDNSVTRLRPGDTATLSDKVKVCAVHPETSKFTVASLAPPLFIDTCREAQSAALNI